MRSTLLITLLLLCIVLPSLGQFTEQPFPANKPLNAMSWPSTNTGYVAGIDGLYKTTDAGLSWTKLSFASSPNGGEFYLAYTAFFGIHFLSNNVGYAVGWTTWTQGDIIAKTIDGGVSWSIAYMGAHEGFVIDNSLFDVHFFDANNGIAVGARGHYVRTQDGGANWTLTDLDAGGPNQDILDIGPANATTAYITSQGSIWKITNAGATITPLTNVPSYNLHRSGHFFDPLNGIIAAGDGIYKTADGGQTWTRKSHIPVSGGKMFFLNANEGYMANDNSILKTTDAGELWEPLAQTPADEALGVFFSSPTQGFLIGGHYFGDDFFATTQTGSGPTKPVAGFLYPTTEICRNVVTTFENLGNPADSYQWFVNGTQVSTSFDLQYAFPQNGSHQVKLRATRGIYTDEESALIFVFTPDEPPPFTIYAQPFHCEGATFYSKLAPTTQGTKYTFELNGQEIIPPRFGDFSNELFFNIPNLTTSGTLTIVAATHHACIDYSSSQDFEITVIPADYAMDIVHPTYGCRDQPIQVTINNSLEGINYGHYVGLGWQGYGNGGPLTFTIPPITQDTTFPLYVFSAVRHGVDRLHRPLPGSKANRRHRPSQHRVLSRREHPAHRHH